MNPKIAELLRQMQERLSPGLIQAKKRNFDKMGTWDKQRALKAELRDELVELGLDGYFWVEDLFDDVVVVRISTYYEMGGEKLLKFPYVIEDNVVIFGSPEEVEVVLTYLPITEANSTAEQGQEEVKNYKLIQGAKPFQIPLISQTKVQIHFDKDALAQSKKKNHSENLQFKDSVVTVFETPNSQGQYYPKSVWQNNLAQLNERAQSNKLLGEVDHPESPSVTRQCIKYTRFWFQGNEVHAEGEILATMHGKDLMVMAASGVPIALSSRGYGSVQLQEVGGKKFLVIQDDFHCETFDAVWAPSAGGSYIQPDDVSQSQDSLKALLTQSIKGAYTPMNPIQVKLAMLQGQIEMLKLQGYADIAKLEQEFEKTKTDLEQMQTGGVAEEHLLTFLNPFGERVAGAIKITKPGDPDKNTGVFNPSRTQSAESSQSVTQGRSTLSDSERAALARVSQMDRDSKINELIQKSEPDPSLRPYLQAHLKKLESADEVAANFDTVLQDARDLIGISFGHGISHASFPSGVGLTEKEKRYQAAPKTPEEAIQKLTEGIEDAKDEFGMTLQSPANKRWVLQQMLTNHYKQHPAAMHRYLQMAQGRLEQAGEMTTGDLTTANAALFPIIRRAYPRLIAHLIASIQPMESDTGTIYFLDTYNEDGAKLDENHYYTYADNTELGTAKKIKVKLSQTSISATSKKLQTEISYETMQDMMYKFGLDAQNETMEAAAAEIAREWNNQILVDLAFASNTAGNINYGLVAPSGYTQIEWDQQQLFIALQKASNNIYAYRYGEMTHIICGSNTALYLSRMGAKGGFIKAQGDEMKQIYAGLNLFGTINGLWQVWTAPILDQVYPNKAITLRKGDQWSDTPYVFAPYATAVTPAVHDAQTFKMNQGIMDRAGRKIVVSRAIGSFTFQPGVQGTPI